MRRAPVTMSALLSGVLARPLGQGSRIDRTLRILGVLVALFGLCIRLFALGRHAINADQAVVGLMAHQILHGHPSAFYWGQSYGGGEPYVVALVFAIFGQSTFSLGLTPVLLDLLAAVLVWRIGRRLFGGSIGAEAALLFWIWPEVYIWQSTIEYGFRWFVLDLGLGALLLTLRIVSRATRHQLLESAALGLCLGAGWWGSPEIMYFVVPIALYVALQVAREHFRIPVRAIVAMIAGAVIGAAAWLEVNLRQHFVSLHSGIQPDAGFLHHAKIFVEHTLPLLLGLQFRVSGRWVFGAALGQLANVAAIGLGIIALGVLAQKREALLLVIFCIVAPIIYSASPFTWYWADGRYAVFLAPATALLAVAGVHELFGIARISRVLSGMNAQFRAVLVIVIGLGLTLAVVPKLAPYRPDGVVQTGSANWTSWRSDPSGGLVLVANRIRASGIEHLYAGYWVAYPLMFASRETIVASDISYVRNPLYLAEIEHERNSAWLFLDPRDYRLGVALTGVSLMDPSCAALGDRCLVPAGFERYLRGQKIAYRSVEIAPFLAVVPDRPVDPVVLSRYFHLRAVYEVAP